MSIGTSTTFCTAGPHAAVVHVDDEELGRARFYLNEGRSRRQAAFAAGHLKT